MNRTAAVLILMSLSSPVFAAPEVLIDTDFASSDLPIQAGTDVHKEISGVLPSGWAENSEWNDVIQLSYQKLTQGSRTFLRMDKKSIEGTAQLSHSLANLTEDGYYRVTFTARSEQRVSSTFGIRFAGPPYSFPWSVSPDLTAEWQEFRYDIHLAAQPQPVGIWIVSGGSGAVDIQHFRLERLSKDDLIDEIKAANPNGEPNNLVRNTRFPLGMQSGWSFDRDLSDGDQVTAETDSSVIGPSGCPSLRLKGNVIRVYLPPFVIPLSFERHTASLYVRGTGSGRLTVTGDGRDLAGKSFTPSPDEWQRVVVPFNPVFEGKVHGLRIDGKGAIWIDALQVETGGDAQPYHSQMPAEVALGFRPSEKSPARVHFTEDPPFVTFAVTGSSAGNSLHARVVDVYGDEKDLAAVPLHATDISSGELRYDVFPQHPLGAFRVEVWVENSAAKRVSTFNEIVVLRLHRPRHWNEDAPGSFFGVHTQSANRHLVMAKAIGINWCRLHDAGTNYIGWSWLEPEKGRWQFFDQDIDRYRDHHLKILGMLSTAPGWATALGKPATGYFDRYLEPANMDDFANYVRVTASHYKGVIDAYEIWNEPWGDFWRLNYDPVKKDFVRSKTAADDYAQLMKAGFQAAKAVDPAIKILGFNTTGGSIGADWTRGVLQSGGIDNCDAFSYHYYTGAYLGFPGDDARQTLVAAESGITPDPDKMPKPVWMSEGNPVVKGIHQGFYHYTVPFDEKEDVTAISNRLCRYLVSIRSLGVKKGFLYTMHGHNTFGPEPADWRTLVTDDGYLHPSAAALSALAYQTEDTRFVNVRTVGRGVYAYLFETPAHTRAVAILSSAPNHAAYRLKLDKGLSASDLFGNPLTGPIMVEDNLVTISAAGSASQLERRLPGISHL